MRALAATAIFILLLSNSASAQNEGQAAAIKKVVAYCVNVVHQTKLGADQSYMRPFYQNFDAFYNPASGRVENSARLEGDQKPLFIFEKCVSEQRVPLTSRPRQTEQPHAAICTNGKVSEPDGECWIRLSPGEKQIVENAFLEGGVAAFDNIERQMYSREAMNPAKFPSFPDHLLAGLDALYAVPANRTISFADASDLVVREQVSPTNPDLRYLTQMYRNHQKPLVSGYIQKFVPPNKLVIAEWNDSENGKMGAQLYGNPTQTITMFGIADSPASTAMVNFMNALVNIKSCHTLWTESDGLAHMKSPASEALQKGLRSGYSTELAAVVNYPNESETDLGPQFFNAKGELSGEILLDMNEHVCDRPNNFFGEAPVTFGDLVFGGADRSDYEPWLDRHSKRFISLNTFVLANHLQPTANMNDDPRLAFRGGLYFKQANPLSEAVTRVIKVGAGT